MSDAPAAPFISDPAGSFEDAESNGVMFPSSVGDTMDWFGTSRQLGRAFLRATAEGGMQDPMTGVGQNIVPPEEPVAPTVLQEKYGIPGHLEFTRPMPEDVAESMHRAKREEMLRADAIERRPSGLMAGTKRYGAQFIADLLDPVNIAATMVPIAPEIDFGVTAASPLIERMAARAGQGAVSGAAGMVPLAGLKYTMGRAEQSDYDAYNALADIAVGAGIGAVLHVGGGALGDYLTERTQRSRYGARIADTPDGRNAALRAALAQFADNRPIEVEPVFDSMEPGGNAPYPPEEPIPPYAVGWPPEHIVEPVHPEEVTPGARPTVPEPKEPQRLVSWLVANGGVQDPGGDVRSSMGGYRGRPGLIANQGRTLDDAALNAWEAGFFPDHSERPTINELLDAIDDDLKGVPRFSHHDEAALAAYHEAQDHNAEVVRLASELGLPTENITRQQFYDLVADHLTPDDFDARIGAEHERAQALYEEAERQAAVWVAHHGTPHEFDRFDTSKIGSGEGAQAYGHGLYFAENEGVADSYRRNLSRNQDVDFILDGREHHGDELENITEPGAAAAIDRMIGTGFDERMARGQLENDISRADSWLHVWDDETIREDLANYAFPDSDEPHATIKAKITPEMIAERRAELAQDAAAAKANAEQALSWFDANKDRVKKPEQAKGNLYTVHIKAKPEEMLDWDRPLSEQPHVQEALRQAGFNENEIRFGNPSGEDAYRMLETRERGDSAAASKTLHEAGIKGIRYLDRDSRIKDMKLAHDIKMARLVIKAHEDVLEREPENVGVREALARNQQVLAQLESRPQETPPSHNVVVFDHNDVEITHRNGEPVERHTPSAAEVHELQGQEPHGGFDAEHFYGADQGRSLEDLENEHRQEAVAAAARERTGGIQPGGPAAGTEGGLPGGIRPGGSDAGLAGRTPETSLNDALRAAAGREPRDADAWAADAAAKLRTPEQLKAAQVEIEDSLEYFRRADAAGELSPEDHADLEAALNLDTEAASYREAAMQAGACVARGLAGGAT